MQYIARFFFFIFITLFFVGCTQTQTPKKIVSATTTQDVQIFTSKNSALTPQSIEDAFVRANLNVIGNNNMNKPFVKRFGKVHYATYNLAMFMSNNLTFKLIKKYPEFGALAPLSMSIWSDKNGMNIATLTLQGMARATKIPLTDPDLIAYAQLIHKALYQAMPQGEFRQLPYTSTDNNNSYQVNFTASVTLDKGNDIENYIEDFEAEFEAEMEPYGFLFPNYTNIQEELFDEHNYKEYEFYHTYSICKFDVIYPVSKLHPEAGAWAPCSFYIYKKKGETKMHMGFLGVDNWITTLNIKDKASLQPLQDAQGMIVKILNEMI